MKEFIFDNKHNLIDVVLRFAVGLYETTGETPSLIAYTYSMPVTASVRFRKALEYGKISNFELYIGNAFYSSQRSEINALRKLGTVNSLRNHSKLAILQTSTQHVVILSSNNWSTCSGYEFTIVLDDDEAQKVESIIQKAHKKQNSKI